MIPSELRSKIHDLFKEKKSLSFIADLYGLDVQELSTYKQIYARDTYTERTRLTDSQKALIRAQIEQGVDDSHISENLGIDRTTIRFWRLKWGYKPSKFAAVEEKKARAREAYYAWLQQRNPNDYKRKAIIQRKVVAMGSGSFSRPVFPKPKTYNDYLKEQREKVRPIFKSTYRPRYHLGADIIIPV
jgi:Zn-dependent M32 family carboxypeptidase